MPSVQITLNTTTEMGPITPRTPLPSQNSRTIWTSRQSPKKVADSLKDSSL